MTGEYTSVTESSCNLTVTLRAARRATLSQTCRDENRSHQDLKSNTSATWTSNGKEIVVSYGGRHDSLRFDPALPFNFGRDGAAAGLVVKGKPPSESQFAGYEEMWRRPASSEK